MESLNQGQHSMDSLARTIGQAPGKGWCETHHCALQDIEVSFLGRMVNMWDNCTQCQQEQHAQAEAEQKRQEQRDLLDRITRAGVPARYHDAQLTHFQASSPHMETVYQAAIQFCQPSTTLAPRESLLFLGNVGTGKTLLACAIIRTCLEGALPGLRMSSHYCTAAQLIRRIKMSWRRDSTESEADILAKLAKYGVLVIDEIGVQFNSDTERLLLTEIINDRYNLEMATILISNLTLSEFTNVVGERIVDRFRETGRVLVFDWASQRGKGSRS